MASIDTRVVEAQFKNEQFGKGVSDTMSALDRLKSALRLEGATEGSSQAARGLSDLGNATDGIGGRFSAMSAVALGALASIGAKAVSIGGQMLNSLTLGPVMQGFQEYETNMNSVQTILANTQASGATLQDVNAALDQLNTYSDQTIYNFSEMARNIGTFTAAGVNLDTATGAIKGIANLAALSGSNSEQASGAMYQLSQAISAGRVSLQDWNSVVNAGMGGTVFQRALAQTAQQMGTLSEGTVTLSGDMQNVSIAGKSFRESIDATNGPSWLTSDVLTATLEQFTGDMSDAELAAQGFSAEMIASIQAQAQTAVHAATEVKTFSGLVDTIKEGIGSGWSSSFRLVIGDFEEAKTLFTQMSNSIGGFFQRQAASRNEMLQGWKDAGGRTALIEGLTDAFWALAAPLAQVGMAFRDVFPKSTGQELADATRKFAAFMASIQPAPETLDRLRRTFAGVFAVLGIVWEVIKQVAGVIGDLVRRFSDGDGGILKFTASIGDFLVALHESIKNGQGLTSFFDNVSDKLGKVVDVIKAVTGWFGSLFDGLNFDIGGTGLGNAINGILTFGDAGESTISVWDRVKGFFSGVVDFFQGVWHFFAGIFQNIGDALNNPFQDINYDDLMKGLEVGMLGGIAAFLAKLASALKNFNLFGGGGNGIFDSIKDGLDNLSGTLGAMQNNLNATALLKIAGAVAILAVAMVLLASIDAAGLTRAAIAMAVLFGQLAVGMKAFNKAVGYGAAAKMNLLAPALILISIAVVILAGAVKMLAELSWEELAKGLIGVIGLLMGMAVAVRLMSSNTAGMATAAVGLLLISVAIKQLVGAVQDFAQMDWGEMAKGLTGVAALLLALALFTRFAEAGAGGLAQGAGILLLAYAITQLVDAVIKMSTLSYAEIARGMTGIAAGLAVMAVALKLMPSGPSVVLAALAMTNIATALNFIADVIIKLGNVSWEQLARGMVGLAASLGVLVLAMQAFKRINFLKMAGVALVAIGVKILADALTAMAQLGYDEIARGLTAMAGTMLILGVAMKFMQGSIAGAAALVIVAAALHVLLPVLLAFADMDIGDIAAALGMLAGVFVIFGLAGLVLGPIVPVLLGLAAAIALFGVAVALAGAGVFLFATGLTLLAAAGAAATAGIVAIVSGLIGLIPLVLEEIGLGIVAFAQVIVDSAPVIGEAIMALLRALLNVVIESLPLIGQTILQVITTILTVLTQAIPQIVEAGFQLLIGLLRGIADHIGEVVRTAVDVIVNFLNGIAQNVGRVIEAGANIIIAFMQGLAEQIPRVVDAGFQMIIDTINGIARAIDENSDALADAGWNLAESVINGIVDGIGSLAGRAMDSVTGLAGDIVGGIGDALGIGGPSKVMRDEIGKNISRGIAVGVETYSSIATDSTVALGNNLITTMGKSIAGLGNLIGGMDEINPVITPVLDLSDVQRNAGQISDILGNKSIDLTDVLSKAGDASAGYNANQEAIAELVAANAGTTVSLTQVNNSPKALSTAEIYRNTNNQLSQARSVLKNAN